MDELYNQMWRMALCFFTIVGGFGALWVLLEWGQELAEAAAAWWERRRRSYRRVAARHGRTVKDR